MEEPGYGLRELFAADQNDTCFNYSRCVFKFVSVWLSRSIVPVN